MGHHHRLRLHRQRLAVSVTGRSSSVLLGHVSIIIHGPRHRHGLYNGEEQDPLNNTTCLGVVLLIRFGLHNYINPPRSDQMDPATPPFAVCHEHR